jgi:hypothetical protein
MPEKAGLTLYPYGMAKAEHGVNDG